MKMIPHLAIATLLLSLTSAFAKPKPAASEPAPPLAAAALPITADETARFLAGMPVTGPLEAQTRTAAWRAHASEFEASWQRMETRQLSKVRVWAHGVPTAKALYYFFSGPDFLYADLIFPDVSTYILCAIEPVGGVGKLTDLREPALAATLRNLRGSLGTMMKYHYFITKEMRAGLGDDQTGGTLPLLYVFLARGGHTIRSVTPIADGVKIVFRAAQGGTKTLYYYRTDLSNSGANTAFFEFCKKQRGAVALLKSASYLLHQSGFSRCRDFLLENSSAIVQDDSGIPYRDLVAKNWNIKPFGQYAGTYGEFAKYNQRDLLAVFRGGDTRPLGFAFGYQPDPERAALMIATKR
jgi:hypothetical protein